MKFLFQFKRKCPSCARDVDVVARDDQAGLLFSRHGRTTGNLSDLCAMAGVEYVPQRSR